VLYRVKDLSPEQRQAVEVLLGHPVSEDEAVSIKTLSPSTILSPSLSAEDRIKAFRALSDRFSATRSPEVSIAEESEAADEAMRSTRPDYRPAV
jgi:hypothetical protein